MSRSGPGYDSQVRLPTDEELLPHVAAMAAGDPDGLVAFHAAVGPWVLGAIGAIVGPGSDAESLLQTVFLELWREAAQYDRHFGRPFMWAMAAGREAAVASLDRARRGALDGAVDAPADHPLSRLTEEQRLPIVACWRGALPTPDDAAAALSVLVAKGSDS